MSRQCIRQLSASGSCIVSGAAGRYAGRGASAGGPAAARDCAPDGGNVNVGANVSKWGGPGVALAKTGTPKSTVVGGAGEGVGVGVLDPPCTTRDPTTIRSATAST